MSNQDLGDHRAGALADVMASDVDSWFLMDNVYPMLGILTLYLGFVLRVGPDWMKQRKPFSLQPLLVVYNGILVAYNLWICVNLYTSGGIPYIFSKNWCKPISNISLTSELFRVYWWYNFSKIVELADTVLFVLRKKDNQVTFLHVLHHSLMMISTWWHLKYNRGEQAIIVGFVNSAVHVIMYSYYMVAAMGPQYQKYLWWKKYMTRIQLVQFCILMVYLSVLLAFDCGFPKNLTYYFIVTNFMFLVLFSLFYKKTYNSREKHMLQNGKRLVD